MFQMRPPHRSLRSSAPCSGRAFATRPSLTKPNGHKHAAQSLAEDRVIYILSHNLTEMIRAGIVTIILYIANGCTTNDKYHELESWAKSTKEIILKQSDFDADSTSESVEIFYNQDSTKVIQRAMTTHYYLKGHELYNKVYSDGRLMQEVFFSTDGKFSYGREVCEDGQSAYEGFTYLDSICGPSKTFYCNGKIWVQKFYHNGKEIGLYRQWRDNGELWEEEDYGNLHLVDSLPIISR